MSIMKRSISFLAAAAVVFALLPCVGTAQAQLLTVEGESMTAAVSVGAAHRQNMAASWPNSGFSGGYQLWYQNTSPTGEVTLTFTIGAPFSGSLFLSHCKAGDYGIFDVFLDGEKVLEGLDMYNASLIHSGSISLGQADLAAGSHTIKLTCIGKNEKSRGYHGSVDALQLYSTGDNTPSEPIDYDIPYTDAVALLTDLESVARLPEADEVGAAATSYDRDSYYDEATDTYVNWSDSAAVPSSEWKSNGDGGGNLGPVGSDGILAADIKGSGMIIRSWFATVWTGNIEFYIDGAIVPTIAMPLKDFISAKGRYEGLDNMVYETTARGYNNYVPITFNESCRIVLRGSWGQYFHFSYRLFGEDTTVEPFPTVFSTEQRAALETVNAQMGNCAEPPVAEGQVSRTEQVTVPAGETVTAMQFAGEAAITQFKVTFDSPLAEYDRLEAMQKLEVLMYWDGSDAPAVWAPIGDFFANACGGTYESIPMGITADGVFYSYWYMPYADGAKIAFKNMGDTDYAVTVEAVTAPLSDHIQNYGRFHAKWSVDRFQPERTDRAGDYTLLVTEGRGRFCGFNLHVNNITGVGWWGEGDEKFFVNGEKFPSTFGTGSEDYFGYAWCSSNYFNNAFHAQNWTVGAGIQGRAGDYNNVRFQLSDNIPFTESFEASIEKFHTNEQTQYLVTAYWYLSADGTDPYSPVEYEGEEARRRYMALDAAKEMLHTQKNTNALEGEQMTVISKQGADVCVQNMAKDWPRAGNFSGGKQLFSGITVTEDAEVTLLFTMEQAYEGPLSAILCTAADYATLQLLLDGEELGEPIDCYNARGVRRSAIKPLGNVSLAEGNHQLTIRVVGKNAASPKYLFGFDCLILGEHLLTYCEEKPATCAESGYPAHWVCNEIDCERWYADRFGTEEITKTTYPQEQHDDGVLSGYVAPTEDEDGYSGDLVCGKCGTLLQKGVTLPAGTTLGDVNGDGKVDSTDARLTLQYFVGSIDADDLNLAAADVDGNGKVDSTDARLILQRFVGSIDKFPTE